MITQHLNDGWIITSGAIEGSIEASVPGCVTVELFRAGVIPDPFYRDNNEQCKWIENEEWTYTLNFDAERTDGAHLVFEGLDTYASVYLNGERIGECDDMFIPYRFDVDGILRARGNKLEVHFRSPVREVDGRPPLNGAFTTERMNTRRIQCTYGWDWLERFVTAGIHRPVYIEYDNGIDLEDIYIYTEHIDSYGASLNASFEFKNYGKGAVAEVEILSPSGERVAKTAFFVDRERYVRRFDIPNPQLWYPRGYGEQPLYTVLVRIGENEYRRNIGIRILRILQLPDEAGSEYHNLAMKMEKAHHGSVYGNNDTFSGFTVLVNGVRIYCRGGNWVPCEPFVSEESDEKIESLINMACDMGVNFLRVWGGGHFERESFYTACDRAGILVAQDFLMACGEYPEREEWFIDRLRREARFAARYLRNHPSLAWWHGDNENATEGSDLLSDYTGRESALSGIADAIYELDPSRVFLPSSPYGGNTYGSVTVGTTHTTNFLGDIFRYFDESDCVDYKEYLGSFVARFISEEGTFGAVSDRSMLRFMTKEDLLVDTDEKILRYHTKGNPALEREIFDYIRALAEKSLGGFIDSEDRLFKYRYMQYEWVRVALESARRNIGYNSGMIFWMYNDCWPAALGWAFVDYYLLPKASYYPFKRLSGHVTTSLTVEDGEYRLYISTDDGVERDGRIRVYRYPSSNTNVLPQIWECDIRTGKSDFDKTVITLPMKPDGALTVVDTHIGEYSDRCWHKDGILGIYPRNNGVTVTERGNGYLTLSANGYIHAVELDGEYVFSDNYFQMLDGESVTVTFERARNARDEEITVRAYSFR